LVSYSPREAHKFAVEERKPSGMSKSNMSMEQMIENATALSKSLPQMADQLVTTLTAVKDERDAIEEDLNKKREEYQEMEASLAAARRQLSDIQAERDRILGLFKRMEKQDAA
jgi:hypothetical protein